MYMYTNNCLFITRWITHGKTFESYTNYECIWKISHTNIMTKIQNSGITNFLIQLHKEFPVKI